MSNAVKNIPYKLKLLPAIYAESGKKYYYNMPYMQRVISNQTKPITGGQLSWEMVEGGKGGKTGILTTGRTNCWTLDGNSPT